MSVRKMLWFAAGILGAQIAPPHVPDNLKAPAAEVVVLKASGSGKQIYVCQGGSGWVLEAPKADLFDAHGKWIGRHYEGPTWQAADGSKVVGEVQQRAAAPRAGAVPWLLLKAKSTTAGTFGHVTYIQRVNTSGGASSGEGCDSAHAGKEVAVPYQADYYFYAPRP